MWDPEIGFVGDAVLVARATTASRHAYLTSIHPYLAETPSGDKTALSALAAMTWATGGRGIIITAPPHVLAVLDAAETDDPLPHGDYLMENLTDLDELIEGETRVP